MEICDFWKHVDRSKGRKWCWPWIGKYIHKDGHVRIFIGGRWVQANRYAYEFIYGAIPPGYKLYRICETPYCCNQDHWQPRPI